MNPDQTAPKEHKQAREQTTSHDWWAKNRAWLSLSADIEQFIIYKAVQCKST